MGLLGEAPIPTWHPAPQSVRDAAARVRQLCRQHRLNPALGLRFCLEHPYVATTLVGMASVDHVRTNLVALNLTLEKHFIDDMERAIEPVKILSGLRGEPKTRITPSS